MSPPGARFEPGEPPELFGLSGNARPEGSWPGATTRIVGVLGFPVRHSLSPRLHNTAYAVMGLDWCYLAFEVPQAFLERAIAGAAALGLRGLSVTMPHKDAVARLATRHSRQVRRLGSANTLIFEGAAIVAESCDGDGLLDDLRQGAGFDPAGRRCGVIGAGGAGRAAVLALAEAGAAEIVVVNRTSARAWRSVALAPKVAHVGRPEELRSMDLVIQATPAGMPAGGAASVPAELPAQMARRYGADSSPSHDHPATSRGSSDTHLSADLVGAHHQHQETGSAGSTGPSDAGSPSHPCGGSALTSSSPRRAAEPTSSSRPLHSARSKDAKRADGPPGESSGESAVVAGVDPSFFGAGQLVMDLVYDPPLTAFLLEAQRQGATVRGGLGMLVHQAARQIRLFTGAEPPLEAMWAAVRPHESGAT
ncbi:MAG: hypothetical protein ABSD97_05365 [Acidimicrobiales bacterium]